MSFPAQMEGEPRRHYNSFLYYLQLPPPRPPYHKLAARLGYSYNTLKHIAADYKWRMRAELWDSQNPVAPPPNAMAIIPNLVPTKVSEETQESLDAHHLETLATARVLGSEVIQDALKKYRDGELDVTVKEALQLIKAAVSLERLVLGGATSRVEGKQLNVDVLSLEDSEKLLELLDKIEDD